MSKPTRFLSKSEVRDRVKLSYAEIARREKDGRFPRRLRLGGYRNSRTVWLESEIEAHLQALIAKRDADILLGN